MPEFKNFKFVSPGVQIKEIDNSQRPRKAESIGPVVIGRARKGLAMEPIKVESYSDFVDMFGDTVAGQGGGDVYRNGNDMQSPMYGTYASKAFLRANVAPLTYIRVLGQEASNASAGAGQADQNSPPGGTGLQTGENEETGFGVQKSAKDRAWRHIVPVPSRRSMRRYVMQRLLRFCVPACRIPSRLPATNSHPRSVL